MKKSNPDTKAYWQKRFKDHPAVHLTLKRWEAVLNSKRFTNRSPLGDFPKFKEDMPQKSLIKTAPLF